MSPIYYGIFKRNDNEFTGVLQTSLELVYKCWSPSWLPDSKRFLETRVKFSSADQEKKHKDEATEELKVLFLSII